MISAVAFESIDPVLTCPAIQARTAQALINVDLTPDPFKSRLTLAAKVSDEIPADASIETRIRHAFVDVGLASLSCPTGRTGAGETTLEVLALTTVLAGRRSITLINVLLAIFSRESWRTRATYVSPDRGARRPILTLVVKIAIISWFQAVGTRKSWLAVALEGAWFVDADLVSPARIG